jgi:dihydropyrimidinase
MNNHKMAVWQGIINGTFQVVSSDHCPYRYDGTGKLAKSQDPTFKEIPNGVPGIELRMPLLFSEEVCKGRIELNHFVALTSTNAAKLYGLYPRKGTISIGADADITIWDAEREVKVTADMLHDNVGYMPYEGRVIRGWPVTVINRGRIVVNQGELHVERGSGTFLPCARPDMAKPLERIQPEMDPARNFGAELR